MGLIKEIKRFGAWGGDMGLVGDRRFTDPETPGLCPYRENGRCIIPKLTDISDECVSPVSSFFDYKCSKYPNGTSDLCDTEIGTRQFNLDDEV